MGGYPMLTICTSTSCGDVSAYKVFKSAIHSFGPFFVCQTLLAIGPPINVMKTENV